MSTTIEMEPVRSFDIDTDMQRIGQVSASTPSYLTFKNLKKWVKYISYALILLLTMYTIFSNVLINNDETKKAHDSKVDYAIKSLFKVVQMTNGMPSIGEISLGDSSNIDELGSNIDQFINALASVTTTTEGPL